METPCTSPVLLDWTVFKWHIVPWIFRSLKHESAHAVQRALHALHAVSAKYIYPTLFSPPREYSAHLACIAGQLCAYLIEYGWYIRNYDNEQYVDALQSRLSFHLNVSSEYVGAVYNYLERVKQYTGTVPTRVTLNEQFLERFFDCGAHRLVNIGDIMAMFARIHNSAVRELHLKVQDPFVSPRMLPSTLQQLCIESSTSVYFRMPNAPNNKYDGDDYFMTYDSKSFRLCDITPNLLDLSVTTKSPYELAVTDLPPQLTKLCLRNYATLTFENGMPRVLELDDAMNHCNALLDKFPPSLTHLEAPIDTVCALIVQTRIAQFHLLDVIPPKDLQDVFNESSDVFARVHKLDVQRHYRKTAALSKPKTVHFICTNYSMQNGARTLFPNFALFKCLCILNINVWEAGFATLIPRTVHTLTCVNTSRNLDTETLCDEWAHLPTALQSLCISHLPIVALFAMTHLPRALQHFECKMDGILYKSELIAHGLVDHDQYDKFWESVLITLPPRLHTLIWNIEHAVYKLATRKRWNVYVPECLMHLLPRTLHTLTFTVGAAAQPHNFQALPATLRNLELQCAYESASSVSPDQLRALPRYLETLNISHKRCSWLEFQVWLAALPRYLHALKLQLEITDFAAPINPNYFKTCIKLTPRLLRPILPSQFESESSDSPEIVFHGGSAYIR